MYNCLFLVRVKMINKVKNIVFGMCLCSIIGGCSIYNREYYIPIDNQVGDAQFLSKNDKIRVVMPYLYNPASYRDLIKPKDKNDYKIYQKNYEDIIWSNDAARDETAKRLQLLGYNVVDTGYYPKNNGQPTVIALIDSAPIKGSEKTETHTWTVPVFTDAMGKTTLSETQGITLTRKIYYYKVKLVRPEGKDNALFKCNNEGTSIEYCIAPNNPNNYKTIFSSYATLSTDNPNSFINLNHLTAAVFYDYPNTIGKKWIYFTMGGYTPIYITEPNAPKPTDKK